jgi:HNH endonuclease
MNKAEKIAVQEWVALHRCCAVCWWPESDLRRRLEVHHLIGGAGRKHDIRNYLSLCERCHGILHSGKVYSGLPDVDRRILLTAKQESDPDNYDPKFLASLKHKKHLGYDPEPIPEYYLGERQRNVAGWKYRKP